MAVFYKNTMDFSRMLKCSQQMLMAVQQRLQLSKNVTSELWSKNVTMASKEVPGAGTPQGLGWVGTAAYIPNFDSKMGVPHLDVFITPI